MFKKVIKHIDKNLLFNFKELFFGINENRVSQNRVCTIKLISKFVPMPT